MQYSDIILLGPGEKFSVGESSMKAYTDRPERVSGGAIMVCRRGRARFTINMRNFDVVPDTDINLLPDSVVMLSEASDDFLVEYFVYSRELFEEATFRLDHYFFKFLAENAVYRHTDDVSIRGMNVWLERQAALYADRGHIFRDTITRNRLQNVFLDIYDHIKRSHMLGGCDSPNRREELFQRYLSLVRDNFRERHNVSYYAERMCITTRYLSSIVRNASGESPKDIIDRMIMLEMKLLLRSTNMSIQEIAGHLHFPDQSYMGRYFRKHAGESPSEYRTRK